MNRPGGPSVTRLMVRVGMAAAVLLVAACGPTYPNCNNDDDCKGDKDHPRHEFCVNQKCQQCRKDGDCAAGKQCNRGRCDAIPGWCADDSGCPPEQACLNHRCSKCLSDDQCGEGGKCKEGTCVRKGMCASDDDCPPDQDCQQGRCVGGAPKAHPPLNPSCTLAPIYFDFNESNLSTEATDTIDRDGACIKTVGHGVALIGRSDPRGTEEYNLALSEKRAQQVKDRLMRMGVDGGKMRTLPKGELEATGKDEQGWAQDRRVDFEWQ